MSAKPTEPVQLSIGLAEDRRSVGLEFESATANIKGQALVTPAELEQLIAQLIAMRNTIYHEMKMGQEGLPVILNPKWQVETPPQSGAAMLTLFTAGVPIHYQLESAEARAIAAQLARSEDASAAARKTLQ